MARWAGDWSESPRVDPRRLASVRLRFLKPPVALPEPKPGLVIRYDYLWTRGAPDWIPTTDPCLRKAVHVVLALTRD
jgi:hypothetical protein